MRSKQKSDSISCEIIESYGYLNPDDSKIFAKVSWNGNAPKLDIRKCYRDKNTGELKLSSGISLTEEELNEVISKYQMEKSREVNFDKIIASTSSIVKNRRNGYATQDGFIRLTKKSK